MYNLNQLGSWADHHHPRWIDFLRMVLGIILITKGIAFLGNRDEVLHMIGSSSFEFIPLIIVHYVIAAYVLGGIAVMIGFLTRFAVLSQIPAVVGAIVFIDIHKGLFTLNSEIGYSILILFLLLFFLFYGSGSYSLDNYLRKTSEE
jgi:putative oxidoreductase